MTNDQVMRPDLQNSDAAGGETLRRLCVYNGGFLTQTRVRRILHLAGWQVALGMPGPDDWVGTWGKSPTAPRGETVAQHRDSPILRVEDAFLRSVRPGRDGEPPIGLNLDRRGVHFDSTQPSDLETLLATDPLDDHALLTRARDGIDRLRLAHLSKYNAFDPATPLPAAPYVLVIDQTRGDASIAHGAANAGTFREMLVFAQEENPGARIVIKTHPETAAGHRDGHFGPDDIRDHITLLSDPVSPWALMEGAMKVYTVSSQLGFEAILAGHKPRVFGQPFYSGWDLTVDENPVARRERRLTRAQLFAAAMILYPTWYDPCRDRLCSFEEACDQLEAQTRAWREDRQGYVLSGMRLWKHKPLRRFLGQHGPLTFADKDPLAATDTGQKLAVWASRCEKAHGDTPIRVEDGFLRSRGLGADLVPPLSLVLDDLGIYYDPTCESRLERLIAASPDLPEAALHRAERLIARIVKTGVSKYNLDAGAPADLPSGHRILVPGQVEDDASILTGGGLVRTNIDLLRATRQANPDAVILYKPHPDVEAGLRNGALTEAAALTCADVILTHADPLALLGAADEVWTMTSLLGFEALIRGKPVTCLGAPFYAGWGLTRDLGPTPARRHARPTLAGLIHATLIAYPRYHDPVSNLPCPPEVAVTRLSSGLLPRRGAANRALAKLQGLFSGFAHLWR